MGPADCLVSVQAKVQRLIIMMGKYKLFRHIAYRQLARWCWGILGKEIRIILPYCAVMCIRNFYSPPGPEEEFVFKGFHYADE